MQVKGERAFVKEGGPAARRLQPAPGLGLSVTRYPVAGLWSQIEPGAKEAPATDCAPLGRDHWLFIGAATLAAVSF